MSLIQVPNTVPAGLVQIATGSFSGATVTITGLGGYDYYNVVVSGIRTGSADTNPDYYVRINGNSTSNYLFAGHSNYTAQSAVSRSTGDSSIPLTPGFSSYRQNSSNLWDIRFDNCNNGGFIRYTFNGNYANGSSATDSGTTLSGFFKVASNLSSLVFSMTSPATYDAGTYIIYGGKN